MRSMGPLGRGAWDWMRGLGLAVFLSAPVLAQGGPESLSATFRKAAGRVASSLVSIRPLDASRPIVTVPIPSVGPFRPGDFIPRGVIRSNEVEADAIGSGFLIDADRGIVITTEGVLRGSSQVQVTFSDGTERLSSQIRRDPRSEIAVLVVDSKGATAGAVAWGDSNALEAGDWVIALVLRGARRPRFRPGFIAPAARVSLRSRVTNGLRPTRGPARSVWADRS